MGDNLQKIKRSRISALTNTFNNNVRQLKQYYLRLTNNIIRYRIKHNIKKKLISQLINALNNKIKTKLNNDIDVTNKLTYSVLQPGNNKNALIIGINYINTPYQLGGCIEDANDINSLLLSVGFQNIKLLTDNTPEKPTRETILNNFVNLLANSNSGDILLFFISGHGSQTTNLDGSEFTENDQLIIPSDFNPIYDYELKRIIQTILKPNVTLIAFFDNCFSGSVLDLKYQYIDSLRNNNDIINDKETETNGNVICISGCSDTQTSIDAIINNVNRGAFTWAFLQTFNSTPTQTWQQLLEGMRNLLKNNGFTQIPQLSSGKFIDINTRIFI